MKLTNEIALSLNGATIEKDGLKFEFSASTVLADGKPLVNELVVDGYDEDGEWDPDLCSTFHPGDTIEGEPWMLY